MFKDLVEEIKAPAPLEITGVESLSLRESMGLFFKEFTLAVDKKMGTLKSSLHTIDYAPTQNYLKKNGILFVAHAGAEITTPHYYQGQMGEMESYVRNLINGILLINGLKTETSRLYDWLKHIARTGRTDKSFKWSISDFNEVVDQADVFIKELEPSQNARFPLDQVYLRFEDCFTMINQYNLAVKSIKARDIEILSREISQVYELGSLLVTKIENNDLLLEQSAIDDIAMTVNGYIHLVNLSGAIMGMLNELTAVFEQQLEEFKKFK